MNRIKSRFSIIIALFVALVTALGFAFGALMPRKGASAATEKKPSEIFTAGSGSTVVAYKTGEDDGDAAYVGFSMNQNDSRVYFRRSLAYKWYEKDTDYTGELKNPGKAVYFSMRFSFPAVNFEKFTLTFESDEENVTKDGKTTNKLRFAPDGEAMGVTVVPHDGEEKYTRVQKVAGMSDWSEGDFTLSFAESTEAGKFLLRLSYTVGDRTVEFFNDTPEDKEKFAFTNIGDNYSEYRSSSATKPNTPITFTVEFPEQEEGQEEAPALSQKVLMKELNGQPFTVTGGKTAENAKLEDGVIEYEDGKVKDTKAPVLVLSEKVYAFTLGQKYNLTHHAIDVINDSVTVTRRYYIAQKKDGEYVAPDETTTNDYETLNNSVFFMPIDDTDGDEKVYLSIRFELEDGRDKDKDEKDYIYLSWYADQDAVATLGEGDKAWDYVKAEPKTEGPEYTIVKAAANPDDKINIKDESNYDQTVENYQRLVEEAAKNTSAGEGAYIYLPSFRDLIESKYADYRNLKFSIYYYTKQQSEDASALSQTSLNYNALKLPVSVEGDYCFRVLATDGAGNAIKLYKDGELVEVTGSNIWDFDEIPTFYFSVAYKGVTIEDAKEQSIGYRETTYTITKFDIVALSGYQTDYTLYYFDQTKLAEGKSVPSYSQFVSNVKDYMKDEAYTSCLEVINEYNDEYTKDDEEWKNTHNDYNWRPDSSLSFNPRRSGFYVVEVVVTDAHLASKSETGYQVIDIRNPLDVTPGRSTWLEDNMVSVILFAISGVIAIAIVVLLVVKPSEQTPETVDLNKLKGKKKPAQKK